MKTKNIDFIAAPVPPHFVGNAFRVHNFIPGIPRLDMKSMDPFIMLDYNSKFNFPPTDSPRGVGVHPHKGFEDRKSTRLNSSHVRISYAVFCLKKKKKKK